MDLTWHDIDSGTLVFYLERETSAAKVLAETLPELCRPNPAAPGCYLAAVLGWVREHDLGEIRQAITAQIAGRPMMVLAWVGPSADAASAIEAWVFSDAGVATRQGKGEVDADGYWYARFVDGWK